MILHDFNQKLEYSLGTREVFDIQLLKAIITNCDNIVKTDENLDRQGVDYIATLRRGAEVYIDAKTRECGASKYWKYGEPELALEIYSAIPDVCTRGKVGWTLNEASNVDLILYTFDRSDTNKYYLLPFQHLRLAFVQNFHEWCKKYIIKKQYNKQWVSEAVFVPASVVLDAINKIMQGQINY